MKIAVIGGGIAGATTAFYLTKKGDHVTLFDETTGQATSAAAGIISPWLSQRRNQHWYQLAKEGARFYPRLMSDLGEDPTSSDIYQQTGTILFKKNDDLLYKLQKIAFERRKDAPEIGDISILSPDELQEKIPILTPYSQGLFVTGGARIDGRRLIETLKSTTQTDGATYLQEKVHTIKPIENQWVVATKKKTTTFDKVVLATGAWLPNLVEPLGFDVDVRGQKGQLLHLEINQDTNHWPVIMPQGECDIIPFANGQILVGATHENDEGYDLSMNKHVLDDMLQTIKFLSPTLAQAKKIEARVGTRAYTSDFLPFFGEVATQKGLFVASGLGSSGLTTGPIIGKTLAHWIHGEKTILQQQNYTPDRYITRR